MTYKFPLVPQIININGSPASDLIQQLVDVDHAIRAAMEAISKAMPHGRDYQTATTAFAHMDAYKAFRERLTELEALREEFNAVAMNIADQRDMRAARKADYRFNAGTNSKGEPAA